MSKTKIRVLAAALALFVIMACVVAIVQFSSFNLASDCGNEVLQQVVSPNKTHVAFIFQRDCGATTGFSTQVSIFPAGKNLTDDEAGNVFDCDTNYGKAPSGAGGGPEVNIEWTSNNQMKMSYSQRARIFFKKDSLEGISIIHVTFP